MTSMLSWTWYVVAVSLLVAVGAVVFEATLLAFGRGARWSWLLALCALLLVPVSTLAPQSATLPQLPPVALDVLGAPLLLLPPVSADATLPARAFDLAALLPWLWPAASLLVLALMLLSYAALRRSARSWRPAIVDGAEVLVSTRTGPAVVGLRHPRIVVPEWVLELGEAQRRLMIVHEQEHLRARDPALLFAGVAVVVLLPWNPVAWWALHRLRVALELDCDARVLTRGGDASAYGALLLEVGRRRSSRMALAAAFAEPRVLERRVRALLHWPRARRPLFAAVSGLAALLCFGAAYVAPQPLARRAQIAPGLQATLSPMVTDTPPSLEAGPTFTPFTVAPELQNREEITRALITEYPPLLRDAGIGGSTLVWIFLDAAGEVVRTQVHTSSGYESLDTAALRVARLMRFKPAQHRAVPVPVWIQLPIQFILKGSPRPTEVPDTFATRLDTPPPAPRTPPLPRDQLERGPTFTPFTSPPELLNREVVARLLVSEYPALLRDAGIGGTVDVWFFIDETGKVARTQVKTSSGYTALDEAALRIAAGMRFKPAENRGTVAPVWIQIPILFSAK